MHVIKFRDWIYTVALLFVLSSFCLSHATSHSEINNEPDNLNGADHLAKGDSLLNLNKLPAAIDAYAQAAEYFQASENTTGLIEAYNMLGYCNRVERNYSQSKLFLYKAKNLCDANPTVSPALKADNYYYLGDYFDRIGNGDSALFFHQNALEIRLKEFGDANDKVARSLQGIGDVYNYLLEDYQEAKKYYQKVLVIKRTLSDEATFSLARAYYNIASTARSTKDTELALVYGHQTLRIAEQLDNRRSFLASVFIMLGNVYYGQKEYDSAISNYSKGIAIRVALRGEEGTKLDNYYNNLGSCYRGILDIEQAKHFHEKALRLAIKYDQKDEIALAELGLGLAHIEVKEYQIAEDYLRRSLATKIALVGGQRARLYNHYQHLGNLFRSTGRYDSALSYYQKALVSGVDGFENMDPTVNPTTLNIGNDFGIIKVLDQKAMIFRMSYDQDTSDLKSLRLCFNTYLLADSLISSYRGNFLKEGSRLKLESNIKQIYERAISSAYQLSEITDDKAYHWAGLNLMERSKATILLESLRRVEAFNRLGIPDSIKSQQDNLIKTELELRHLIDQQEANGSYYQQVDSLRGKLFNVTQKQEVLREFIAKVYPKYFQSRFDNSLLSLEEIKSFIGDNRFQIVEYFFGQSAIYAISSFDGNSHFYEIKDISLLQAKIQRLNGLVIEAPKSFKDSFSAYKSLGYDLFTLLLEPVLQDLKGNEQLLIIPDGPLAYLPFDCLLTALNTSETVDFNSLPYLIKTYETRFTYSLNALWQVMGKSDATSNDQILAFSYTGLKDLQGNLIESQANRGREYQEIPGSVAELKAISNIMEGKFFQGDEATEQNFKENADQYGLFHFALHGAADRSSELGSKLIFKQGKSASSEDGQLYPYEIYNLNLNAKLVVLSACETGIGKLQEGEGVYSMGRAFAFAGCPSIVMSLWEVNDWSSSILFKEFYSELKDGNNLSFSLRSSKLKYLMDADKDLSHPHFWSQLQLMGVSNITYSNSRMNWPLYASVAILLFILFGVYMRYK